MKTNKWLCIATLGLLFASCESVETPMFSDEKDAFVAFEKKSVIFVENAAGEVKIPVSLVASKGQNATVNFSIDASAYEEAGTAAKENVNYRVKNESNTLTFTEGGELTQYIVLETIDNDTFDGDIFFDLKLEVVGGSVNLGANYYTTVTLQDDDHPLAAAGILGSYTATSINAFDNTTPITWTCEITSDPSNINAVWISQLAGDVSGATYNPIYGIVADDKNSIRIDAGQDLGTYGSYTLKLDFVEDGLTSITASRNGNSFSINAYVGYAAYDSSNTLAGYIAAVHSVILTKVNE